MAFGHGRNKIPTENPPFLVNHFNEVTQLKCRQCVTRPGAENLRYNLRWPMAKVEVSIYRLAENVGGRGGVNLNQQRLRI